MLELIVESGKILLVEFFMFDLNFKCLVVLLCDYSKEDGSVGFIFNKFLQMKIDELIDEFLVFDVEVYFGGLVQVDIVYYFYIVGCLLEDSIEVSKGVYWGGDFEKFKFLVVQELIWFN